MLFINWISTWCKETHIGTHIFLSFPLSNTTPRPRWYIRLHLKLNFFTASRWHRQPISALTQRNLTASSPAAAVQTRHIQKWKLCKSPWMGALVSKNATTMQDAWLFEYKKDMFLHIFIMMWPIIAHTGHEKDVDTMQLCRSRYATTLWGQDPRHRHKNKLTQTCMYHTVKYNFHFHWHAFGEAFE